MEKDFEEAVRIAADSDAKFDGRSGLTTLGRVERERYMERSRKSLTKVFDYWGLEIKPKGDI